MEALNLKWPLKELNVRITFMNRGRKTKSIILLLLAGVVTTLIGCKEDQVKTSKIHEDILVGMLPEEVKAIAGLPSDVTKGEDFEVWFYYKIPVSELTTGVKSDEVPFSVIFENGKVLAVDEHEREVR